MTQRKLSNEGLVYAAGGAFQLVATLLTLPLMTRVLDQRQFGIAVTLQIVSQLATHLGSAGLPTATMREYFDGSGGPQRSRRLVLLSVPSAAAVALVLLLTAPLWIKVFASITADWALVLALGVAIPRSLTSSGLGYLRATHKVGQFVTISVMNTVGAQLFGVGIAWLLDGSVASYFGGFWIGSVVACGLTWISSEAPRSILWGTELRRVLVYALPTVPHAIATLVLQAGDRVIVERALGVVEVGKYQIAYLLATLPIPALVAFNNAWSPRLAAADLTGDFDKELLGPSSLMLRLVPSGGAICAMLAPVLIQVGLPAEYDADALRTPIGIVSAIALSFAVYVIATQVLIAARKTAALAVVTPLAGAMNIGLNLFLVPRHGLAGAAVATVVTYGLMAIALTVVATRVRPYKLPIGSLALGIAASIYGVSTMLLGVSGTPSMAARALLCVPPTIIAIHSVRSRPDSIIGTSPSSPPTLI